MSDPARAAPEDWLAAALIATFVLANLIGLDRVPFANADEAWIAEPGLFFWRHGTFASQLHAGFFGTERHFLLHAPLFSLIAGWMIWVFGVGIIQVRLVSLTMSALTAAFTWRLGRALLSPRHALLATLLLTWCRTGPYQWEARQSGIVLVDFARYARYDIAIPFFGMIGVLLILPWLLRDTAHAQPVRAVPLRFALAGFSAGLAIACHPIGLICVATLAVLALVPTKDARETHNIDRSTASRDRDVHATAPIAWMLLGLTIALLPLILFVYSGWTDALGQQRLSQARWRLDDPWFYTWNVLREWRRYISVGRGLQFGIPGAWLLVWCSLTGAAALLSPRRHAMTDATSPRPAPLRNDASRNTRSRRLIRAAVLTGFALLALFEREKFFFYLAALWPWIALTVAIGIMAALHSASRIVRIAMIALLALGSFDGVRAEMQLAREAAARTAFTDMCNRLAARIPPDARLLALPTWWLGLEPHVGDYRSLNVPMFFLEPQLADPTGPTFTERLAAIDADVVLFDQAMIDYVRGPRAAWVEGPGTRNPGAEDLERFLATHSVRQTDVTDPSYGRFEIYYLRR